MDDWFHDELERLRDAVQHAYDRSRLREAIDRFDENLRDIAKDIRELNEECAERPRRALPPSSRHITVKRLRSYKRPAFRGRVCALSSAYRVRVH